MFKKFIYTVWSIIIMTAASSGAQALEPENTLYLDLEAGRVTIEMFPDRAPAHVERIKELTREDFYNGIVFHRVIEGFMAQTGDPTGTGMGGSDKPDLPAEFTDYAYKRGTIGMARTSDPNSANSQFFFCFTDDGCSFLTGDYTVWGQVVDGMEFIDELAVGEPPASPDKIVQLQVAADVISQEPAAGDETTPDAESGVEADADNFTDDVLEETEEASDEFSDEIEVDEESGEMIE